LLKTKACDPQNSDPERIHAAAYLAGFVVRAAYIHMHQMRNLFDDFVEDLHEYCSEKALSLPDPDLKIGPASAPTHIVFYAHFQALMHMFNNRLLEDDEIIDKRKQWDQMQQIVDSCLCPLRYCLPATVAEFCTQTRKRDLLNFTEGDADRLIRAATPGLDDFFYVPFEPMPLPLCSLYVNDAKLYIKSASLNSLDVPDFSECSSRSDFRPSCFSLDNSPALKSMATPLRTPLIGPEVASREIDSLFRL